MIKYSLIVLFLISGFGCDGQHTSKKENNKSETRAGKTIQNTRTKMDKFDLKGYQERITKDLSYSGYQSSSELYVKEYHYSKEGADTESFKKGDVTAYIKELVYNTGFTERMIYDDEGVIKALEHYFSDDLEIGIWKTFDADGKVLNEENKDSGYTFGLSQVLAFGKKNDVDFAHEGEIKRAYSSKFNMKVWDLAWRTKKKSNEPNVGIFRLVVLDGTTGKILSDKEQKTTMIRHRSPKK